MEEFSFTAHHLIQGGTRKCALPRAKPRQQLGDSPQAPQRSPIDAGRPSTIPIHLGGRSAMAVPTATAKLFLSDPETWVTDSPEVADDTPAAGRCFESAHRSRHSRRSLWLQPILQNRAAALVASRPDLAH
jgi:hypothetical protein